MVEEMIAVLSERDGGGGDGAGSTVRQQLRAQLAGLS